MEVNKSQKCVAEEMKEKSCRRLGTCSMLQRGSPEALADCVGHSVGTWQLDECWRVPSSWAGGKDMCCAPCDHSQGGQCKVFAASWNHLELLFHSGNHFEFEVCGYGLEIAQLAGHEGNSFHLLLGQGTLFVTRGAGC